MKCPVERGGCGAELKMHEGAFCDECVGMARRIIDSRNDVDDRKKVMIALEGMLSFSIGYFPVKYYSLKDVPRSTLSQDAKAPFFSEAYLYDLMGKEGARTVLAYVRRLCRALGMSDTDPKMP